MTANVVTVTSETAASVVASDAAHAHPTLYYTQDQVDALLAGMTFSEPLDVVTDNYQLLSSHIEKSIRVDPATVNTVLLVAGSASLDGKVFHLLVIGTGDVDFTCSGTDKIGNSTGTTLKITGDPYAHTTIEWDNTRGAWMIHRIGGISVS